MCRDNGEPEQGGLTKASRCWLCWLCWLCPISDLRAGSVVVDVELNCRILASGVKQSTGRRPSPSRCPSAPPMPYRAIVFCASPRAVLPITRGPGRGPCQRDTRSCPSLSAADWSLGEPLPLPRVTQTQRSASSARVASREDDGDMDEDGVCETPWRCLPASDLRIRVLAPLEAPDVPISCLGAFPVTLAWVK